MLYSCDSSAMIKPVIKYPSPKGVNRAHRPGKIAPRQSETSSGQTSFRLVGKILAVALFIIGLIYCVISFVESYSLHGLFNGAILSILGASIWFLSSHEKHVVQHLENQIQDAS